MEHYKINQQYVFNNFPLDLIPGIYLTTRNKQYLQSHEQGYKDLKQPNSTLDAMEVSRVKWPYEQEEEQGNVPTNYP